MSTQIFLPTKGGVIPSKCYSEFFKIAEHSMFFKPEFELENKLYFGGKLMDVGALWSREKYDYLNIASPIIRRSETPIGIPIPTNLFNGDVVTITGTAYINTLLELNDHFYLVNFTYGIYHFDCSSTEQLIPSYNFMPLSTIEVTQEGGNFDGKICFSNQVQLTSKFDLHNTRLIVGFCFEIICNQGVGQCQNIQGDTFGIVSYTLDVERPCAIESTNCFNIRNCCEPTIIELVFKPGAAVGQFFSDIDGNCWEVISESKDVTNFVRNQSQEFSSCTDCVTANPCPLNLVISSCCVDGYELVSGSLPGLNVGDSFVDDDGLCWAVESSGAFPITEESITVSTVYVDCLECKTNNPCPIIYSITSCCTTFSEIISSSISMNVDDVFVDNFGICWTVVDLDLNQLPTNYDIEVVQVHANCNGCTNAHPCPTSYYLTVRQCCDPLRIEVLEVPIELMNYPEGSVIGDSLGMCWEVMSYSSTGTATHIFYPDSKKFSNCNECRVSAPYGGDFCLNQYLIEDCNGNQFPAQVAVKNGILITFGLYYYDDKGSGCRKIIGYTDLEPTTGMVIFEPGSTTCDDCILKSHSMKEVQLLRCSDGAPFSVLLNGPWFNPVVGSVQTLSSDAGATYECWQLVALLPSGYPYTLALDSFDGISMSYVDCASCP